MLNPTKPITMLLASVIATSVMAGKAVEDANFAYRYSAYTEANVIEALADLSQLPAGAQDYNLAKVGFHQFRLQIPFSTSLQIDFNVKSAIISGNMVDYLRPEGVVDQNTDVSTRSPIAVLTNSNVRDERTEVAGQISYFFEDVTFAMRAGASTEDDYNAITVGGDLSMEFNNDNSVFSVGGDYTLVTIEPLDRNGNPDEARNDDKTQFSAYIDFSHTFTPKYVAKFGVEGTLADGYLADPYKRAYVHDILSTVNDARPNNRTQVSMYMQNRYFIDFANAALHADYRFHFDNWEMTSHTFELGWHQGVDDLLRIFDGGKLSSRIQDLWDFALSFRYYSQQKAYFYEHFYLTERDDGYYSSDHRLSNFGAMSFAFRAERQFTNWKLFVGIENYFSDLALAMTKQETFESPALVDWNLFQIGVELKFK